jgi:D-glycero-alpha-D-manno-heptose-7-phosphate kinase
MIITRTPLRISLAGGGTDLASYYRRTPGVVISAAINKYVYIGINRTFTDDYFIKYSALERVREPSEIQHPIIREALKLHPVGPSLEIVSLADIPAGTGLGSSGTFTVGLLRALYALKRQHVTASALAEEACHIEIDLLGRPVGKQDPYIAAFGGLTRFEFDRDGRVEVSPLNISSETLRDMEERLLLFFTGYSRDAAAVLEEQKSRTEQGDESMLESLEFIKQIASSVKNALEDGDTGRYAQLMHEHWEYKKRRSRGMTNDAIDRWYRLGMENGALGGKLVGAGGGGFLLFYAKDQSAVRRAMSREGLREVPFFFDHDGASVLVRD